MAILFSRIGPYHFARLKTAAVRLKVTAMEFSTVDLTYAWDLVEGQDGFERLMLFTGVPVVSQSASQIFAVVDKALDALRPAAVAIPGWSDRCSLAALKWCGRHAVPAIIMSETTAWDDERKTWRELVKKRVVRLCSAGLVGGKGHADYLARLGMARDRIFPGYDAVDNAHFADKTEESRKQKAENRNKYGLPENYFLASARFVEKKNLPRLIQAYALYRKKSEVRSQKSDLRPPTSDVGPLPSDLRPPLSAPWSLVLLGDGPLRPDLCRLISDLSLQDSVLLPGFKQYNELPVYYALADAFVHASTTEQWGLVVNEAMASGLPVLVSNSCGCATDLVQEGRNGFTFDPYNAEQLAQLMFQISAFQPFRLSAFGAESQRQISSWGPERFANGLMQAVECALRVGPIKPTLAQRAILDGLLRR